MIYGHNFKLPCLHSYICFDTFNFLFSRIVAELISTPTLQISFVDRVSKLTPEDNEENKVKITVIRNNNSFCRSLQFDGRIDNGNSRDSW